MTANTAPNLNANKSGTAEVAYKRQVYLEVSGLPMSHIEDCTSHPICFR